MGVDLISALEKVSALGEASTESAPAAPAPPPAQNEQSMAMLQGMLANVQNAPMRKPRKT